MVAIRCFVNRRTVFLYAITCGVSIAGARGFVVAFSS